MIRPNACIQCRNPSLPFSAASLLIHLGRAVQPGNGAGVLSCIVALLNGYTVTVGRRIGEFMAHVIVCGLGQVGFRCTMLLRQLGIPVTVVTTEDKRGFKKIVQEAGAIVQIADARDIDSLRLAGLSEARALLAVTSSDLANLEIAMDAVESGATCRVVIRLGDQTLAARLHRESGIDRTLAMSMVAAPSFAAAALDPSVLGAFEWRGEQYTLVRTDSPSAEDIGLAEDLVAHRREATAAPRRATRPRISFQQFAGSIPGSLKVAFLLISLLAIASIMVFHLGMKLSLIDSLYFVVTTLTTTGYGDINVGRESWILKLYTCVMMVLGSAGVAVVYSIITNYIVSTRFDELAGKQRVNVSGHVIVVGLGNVGRRTVEYLRHMGIEVVAVDTDASARDHRMLPDSVHFLVGDGREVDVLERAGVHRCSAVISVTDNDATNLSTGLSAKKIKPSLRAVVRIFDASFARKVEGVLNIDAALSASKLSAPSFVAAALGEGLVYSFVEDGLLKMIRDDEGRLGFEELELV